MSTRQQILERISVYLASSGMSEREFGIRSVNDHKLLKRLREGRGTLRLIEKVERFLAGTTSGEAA